MSANELLQLRASLARARKHWLAIEDDIAGHDSELDQRVAIARLAILDAADRVDQILELVVA
jgi:hypothetical protein